MLEVELDLTKEERTKLHVNTKRPTHSDPDMIYTVIRFIDFNKYLFDQGREEIYQERPDIGVIVVSSKLKKKKFNKNKERRSRAIKLAMQCSIF